MGARASSDIGTMVPDDLGILLEDADGLVQHCTPSLLRHVGLSGSVAEYRAHPSETLHEAIAAAFHDPASYLQSVAFLRDRGRAVYRCGASPG